MCLKLHGRNLGSFGAGQKNAGNLQTAFVVLQSASQTTPI